METIGSKRSYALIWCMPNNDDDDDWLEVLSRDVDSGSCEGFLVGTFEGCWQHAASLKIGVIVF